MNRISTHFTVRLNKYSLSAAMALLFTSLTANATLGLDSASVVQDQKALGASITMSSNDGYTDYALSFPHGGVAHEFVNSAGQVFEVTWSKYGSRPDMQQLLGNYASRFSGTANGGTPTSRRADRLDPDFELHSKVRMRYFSGTAHLPTSLPTGMAGPLSVPLEKSK